MSTNRITGIAFISFLFSIAGIVISFLTIKEDVTSTAHTIFEYFPMKYGVVPSETWQGAIILGIFTTVLQVITANIVFSKKFPLPVWLVALAGLTASLLFDNWTDIVFRSNNLTGNLQVAIVTTVAFYTLGSEIMQSLSWLVLLATWRPAISDFMWGVAKAQAGFSSISREWGSFRRAANNKELKERIPNYSEPNRGDSKGNGGNPPKPFTFPNFSAKSGQGKPNIPPHFVQRPEDKGKTNRGN